MRIARRITVFLTLLAYAAFYALPGMALAHTTEAIADTGGATLTLGVPGVPLTVEVMLDDVGLITEVAVDDPAFAETKSKDHKVRFANTDDTTRIEVKAKKDKLKTEVKSESVDAVVGTHTWSADLFATGTATVVAFTVELVNGNPEITNVSVDGPLPPGTEFEIRGPFSEIEDDEAESKAKIIFTNNGFTKTLKIEVERELHEDDDDDDHERPVKLKVELRGKDIQELRAETIDEFVGDHVWTGTSCAGEELAVAYTIGADGSVTVTDVTANGAPADGAEVDSDDHGVKVEFAGDEKVEIELKAKGAEWELEVKSKTTEKCDHDDDEDKPKSDDDDDHDDDEDKAKEEDHDDDDDDSKDDDKSKDDDDDHDDKKDDKSHDDDDDDSKDDDDDSKDDDD